MKQIKKLLFALPVLMAFVARAAGGGLGATKIWSRLPELIFAVPFGFCAYKNAIGFWPDMPWWGHALITFSGYALSFYAMEMGHGTFYNMDGYQDHNRDPGQTKPRVQSIEYVVRLFYRGDITKPGYSWACMGLKGFLIGLAAFPWGLSMAVLWPFSYWVSRKVEANKAVAEWVSGAFAGTVALMCLFTI